KNSYNVSGSAVSNPLPTICDFSQRPRALRLPWRGCSVRCDWRVRMSRRIADISRGGLLCRPGVGPTAPTLLLGRRQVVYPAQQLPQGVCRNHQGEMAARVPSAGVHLDISSISPLRTPDFTGRPALPAEPIIWRALMKTRCTLLLGAITALGLVLAIS